MFNEELYAKYGACETNPMPDKLKELRENEIFVNPSVGWDDPDLKKIFRLRLLTDQYVPFWDVSYCYGVMKNGQHVRVELPFSQVPKRGMKKFIVDQAIADGVYAKGIGILDDENISKLW